MSTSMIHGIEKLRNSNYYNWKIQIKMALIKEKVWDVVNNRTPKPQSGNAEKSSKSKVEAINEWETKDENARATILLSVSNLQLPHIRNCKTSAEAWMKLANIHESKGLVHRVYLQKRLF